jgi:hypothetical protein
MTWVIGTATPFGYSAGVSDIRVRFRNGTELDCLQKIYPLGQFVAAGFAGSVRIGFHLLEAMRSVVYSPDKEQAVLPDDVAQWFQTAAPKVFERFGPEETDLRAEVLMLAVHPTEDIGQMTMAFPKAQLYKFASPRFEANDAGIARVISIGSGSDIQAHREFMDWLNREPIHLMQSETNTPLSMGSGLGTMVTLMLRRNPVAGISQHFHVCTVTRGQIFLGNNNHEILAGNAPPRRVEMPKVSTSLTEFSQLAITLNIGADAASC